MSTDLLISEIDKNKFQKYHVYKLIEENKISIELIEKYAHLFKKETMDCELIPILLDNSNKEYYYYKAINDYPTCLECGDNNLMVFKCKTKTVFKYVAILSFRNHLNGFISIDPANYFEILPGAVVKYRKYLMFIDSKNNHLNIYSLI